MKVKFICEQCGKSYDTELAAVMCELECKSNALQGLSPKDSNPKDSNPKDSNPKDSSSKDEERSTRNSLLDKLLDSVIESYYNSDEFKSECLEEISKQFSNNRVNVIARALYNGNNIKPRRNDDNFEKRIKVKVTKLK